MAESEVEDHKLLTKVKAALTKLVADDAAAAGALDKMSRFTWDSTRLLKNLPRLTAEKREGNKLFFTAEPWVTAPGYDDLSYVAEGVDTICATEPGTQPRVRAARGKHLRAASGGVGAVSDCRAPAHLR